MADTPFAQLRDRDFLIRTRRVSPEVLAQELGCHPSTVESYRQRYGVFQRPPWNPVEIELLTRFYGRFPAACIAQGLGRTTVSVYKYANRHGLRPQDSAPATADVEAAFWAAWQAAIRCGWARWAREGLAEGALEIVWRPPRPRAQCAGCAHLAACRALTRQPLRCERLTLRDVLECHLSPADRALF